MTAEQKEIYRENILTQLRGGFPVHDKTILVGLQCGGFSGTDAAEMERELEYLIEKGFVRRERAFLSSGKKHYKLTAAGVEYLEANC